MSSEISIAKRLEQHRLAEVHGHQFGPYIHDIVYGANDGIITTFAVVAGTVGADLPGVIIIVLGVANLLADGVSMAAGAYLSLKSTRDRYEQIRSEEVAEVRAHPELEREEVREALQAKGFFGDDLERALRVLTADEEVWVDTMMVEEHGLVRETSEHPLHHGVATFVSFVLFGSIPLLPYVILRDGNNFSIAIASTALALFLLGLTRSRVTRQRPIRGVLEVLTMGVVSGGIAYGVGALLRAVVGVTL